MGTRYAADTTVPVDRSRAEIEKLLTRHGASAFGYLAQGDSQILVFEIERRRVLMRIPLPARGGREFTHTPTRRQLRSDVEAERRWQQAVCARWRAVVLIVKAKLEAVAAGITTIEREFLADTALPNGQTVADWVAPQLDQVYGSGEMPALLPGAG